MPIMKIALLVRLVLTAFLAFPVMQHAFASDSKTVEVWKDPSCGCCQGWVDHMKAAGFEVRIHNTSEIDAVKTMNRVPQQLASCHTAKIDGYTIEGHVPASDIMRLLKEKPQINGLAVPGMPLGSPGMEVPGGDKDAYDVLSFDERGNTAVYSSHD
jgi:hypothetical protein